MLLGPEFYMNLVLGGLLLLSEVMPFIKSNDYNGLIHFLLEKYKIIKAERHAAEDSEQQ